MYRKWCGQMKCKPYEAYGFLIVFGTLWAFCLVGLGITNGREGIIGAFYKYSYDIYDSGYGYFKMENDNFK